MKTKSLILMLISTLLINCSLVSSSDEDQQKQERDVASFTKINLGVSGTLYLKQGSAQKLVIEAEEDLLEYIETEVDGGKLNIKLNRKNYNYKKINVYITIPEIEGVSVSGSGDIIAETKIVAKDIYLKISGSGKVKIDELEATNIISKISGSGNIHLAGGKTIESHEISISGSGNIESENLEVDKLIARISGSGDCRVNVISELNAKVSGSGKVCYLGKPLIDASVSGSGRVKPIK